jgi:hypothetical protein
VLEGLGQTEFDERTAAALGFENGRRSDARVEQFVQALRGGFGFVTEPGREFDLAATPGFDVKDSSSRYGNTQHFLQAEGLGAELDIVVVPFATFAPFVLNGQGEIGGVGLRVELDDICFADESQPVALEPHTVNGVPISALPIDGAIGACVREGA